MHNKVLLFVNKLYVRAHVNITCSVGIWKTMFLFINPFVLLLFDSVNLKQFFGNPIDFNYQITYGYPFHILSKTENLNENIINKIESSLNGLAKNSISWTDELINN